MVFSSGALIGDAAGLLLLGHDALQVDMKQAVLELGGLDLDMLGELEAALEGAAGDALVQVGRLGGILALAGDGQNAVATSTPRSFSAKPATAMVTR